VPYTSAYLDAALYDVVYSKVVADIPFYVDLAKSIGGPVLEVGCGTGRVLLPTLEAGVEIHGVDLAESMLERLRAKAAARGLSARVDQGDMRDFTMPRRYRLVTIPFRAFLHMESTEDQIRALRCVREHLEPGGLLALNVFYPSWDAIARDDGVRKLSIETTHPDTGQTVRVWDVSRYDRPRQHIAVERQVFIGQRGDDEAPIEYGFTLSWIFRFEMELLLRAAGFTDFEFFGGFERRPLVIDKDEMVVLARRD
jgi:SAM-dependent methyltransferase